jgi:hypothetical protein
VKLPSVRATLVLFALFAAVFVCHVTNRLRSASENWTAFNCGDEEPTFRDLTLYSVYMFVPASANSCINHLRQIDGATQQWAIEYKKTPQDKVTMRDIFPEYLKQDPRCPEGGAYILFTVKDNPKCTVPGHRLPEPLQ